MQLASFDSITVKGLTSLRDAHVELGPLNVLVGANGSGKSNFVNALELLGRIADEGLQAYVPRAGGTSFLLHHRTTYRAEISLAWSERGEDGQQYGYDAKLIPTRDDKLIFDFERIYRAGDPLVLVETGHRETILAQWAERDANARYVLNLLRGCRVYHFHDTSATSAMKQRAATGDNLALLADAGNLAAVLRLLREASHATYRQIVGAVRLVAPFFDDFVLEHEERTDSVRLRWRQADSDRVFSAHQLSDGTLRFICLATLLLDADRLPALVVLDEPELGLHPFAIVQLADMLRAASTKSQVVVATQSVTLIDQVDLSDLVVVEREDGASVFRRPDPEELRIWLDDYSVGDLWQKALIGGRPSRETP